jgi:hypothetical protein
VAPQNLSFRQGARRRPEATAHPATPSQRLGGALEFQNLTVRLSQRLGGAQGFKACLSVRHRGWTQGFMVCLSVCLPACLPACLPTFPAVIGP